MIDDDSRSCVNYSIPNSLFPLDKCDINHYTAIYDSGVSARILNVKCTYLRITADFFFPRFFFVDEFLWHPTIFVLANPILCVHVSVAIVTSRVVNIAERELLA